MILRVTVHDDRAPLQVEDTSQLEGVLNAASEEARTRKILGAVIIEAENGDSITMVVGGEETVLGFEHGHLDPPYYASKGPSDEDNPVMTCFLTFQHHTEFPRRYVIPFVEGVKAVNQFLVSGGLPTCINWVEV